jgi:YidC/Oxa1 family membrane protein insertase
VHEGSARQDFLAYARPTVESEPDKDKPWLDDIIMRVVTEPMELAPRAPVVHKYLLYYGPVKVKLLAQQPSLWPKLLGRVDSGQEAVPDELVSRYRDTLHLDTLTDYRSQGVGPGPWISEHFFSWTQWTYLLIKITNFMHNLLGWLYAIVPNYGVCIILLTVLVRGLMHPISRRQARTSIKMQALMPEIKKLQEKHKDDRQTLAMAQMELWRKHGVNPMGSCWVVLLQMPIFMGLYYALQESIHFRFAEFLWIKNLAAPDMLIWWTEGIPFISRPQDQSAGLFSFLYLGPYFNLLPVIAVTFMIVQQKYLMPPPTDEQQAMQHKMMKYMMIFMGLMFYKVAAGLCIYFIVSSVWGLAERKLLPKAKPAAAPGIAAAGPGGTPGKPAPTKDKPKSPKGKPKSPKGSQGNGAFKKVQEMWAELLKQAKKK